MPRKFSCGSCWKLWKRQQQVEDKEDAEEAACYKKAEALGKEMEAAKVERGEGPPTGNPRNKTALQPGHSLMDWIRLGASGKDLSGVGPRAGHLAVTKHELSRHNSMNDIWIAIRGKVYNVTEYIPFHPGGPDELMRAAGIDATRLFDQVHPWVNYSQILQKCLIGRLVSVEPGTDTEGLFFRKPSSPAKASKSSLVQSPVNSSNNTASAKSQTRSQQPASEIVPDVAASTSDGSQSDLEPPRFDWIQQMNSITIIFYTKPFSNPMVEILPPARDKAINMTLTYDETEFINCITFYEDVEWPCTTKVSCETGKVEMTFAKIESHIWVNYGRLKQQVRKLEDDMSTKSNFVLQKKVAVTHNTYLMMLERTDQAKIVVPIGRHARVFVNVDGQEISRSYTPVPSTLFTSLTTHSPTTDAVCFMIKRYPDGLVSSHLTERHKGDMVYLTRPLGDFEAVVVERREAFVMLAAGTGITPMLGLLVFLLERRVRKCQFLRLLFFNRREIDIPFRNQLDYLSEKDQRLRINHILSEPDENWTGLTGHVNKEMIESAVLEHIKDTGYTIRDVFFFICGPTQFEGLSTEELKKLEILNPQTYIFHG